MKRAIPSDCIGEGSFGKVFVVDDNTVVKVPHANVDRSTVLSTAWLSELSIYSLPLSRDKHVLVPKSITIGHNGMLQDSRILLERIDCSLEQVVSRLIGNVKLVRMLLHHLMEALGHLHSLGIAHRDVHSRNILVRLSTDNEIEEFVLTDFSLSCIEANQEKRFSSDLRHAATLVAAASRGIVATKGYTRGFHSSMGSIANAWLRHVIKTPNISVSDASTHPFVLTHVPMHQLMSMEHALVDKYFSNFNMKDYMQPLISKFTRELLFPLSRSRGSMLSFFVARDLLLRISGRLSISEVKYAVLGCHSIAQALLYRTRKEPNFNSRNERKFRSIVLKNLDTITRPLTAWDICTRILCKSCDSRIRAYAIAVGCDSQFFQVAPVNIAAHIIQWSGHVHDVNTLCGFIEYSDTTTTRHCLDIMPSLIAPKST